LAKTKLEFSRGELIAEKYEVIDLLDESPLGPTYRVKHQKSGKFVRLTMLRPEVAGAEQKDAVIAAFKSARAFVHKNLMKVGELGDHEGVAYYTMEDFEGSTLRELLQEYKIAGTQFATKEAAQVIIAILEALQAAHDSGIVLRALRPEYVLVNVRFTGPRQANFVARIKLVGTAFWNLVPNGTLAEDEFTRGEAQYLAPELKSFEPVATPRSDVYSAGVMFYEMLTGTAPIGTFQQPTKLRPDLPRHINDIVELALANSPEDRYRTASDLVADIQRIFREPDIAAEEERKPLVTPLWWGLAALAVLAVAVILYQMRPDPVEEARTADASLRAMAVEQQQLPSLEEVAAILAKHPPNMIYIPTGPYVAGRMHSEEDAPAFEPLAKLREVDGFIIDAFEYPNLKGALPAYGVTYAEAEANCTAAGKRLCTADEWEKACKGPGNTVYSYGDFYDPEFCGEGLEDRGYPAGSRPECRSRWGVFDISGSFREWTMTAPQEKETRRIVKGGVRHNPQRGTRCSFFTDESTGFKDGSMSFRCCRDPDAPPAPAPTPEPGPETPEGGPE